MSVERADPSMRLQLGSVLSAPEMKSVANGYFLQNLILSGSPVKRSTGSGDIYYSFRAVLIKWGHLVWAMHQLHFSILWIALWLGWLGAVYLDDLMVYSDSWVFHRVRVQFDRLTEAKLTVNFAKCDFARVTVTYLGWVVGQRCVAPVEAKVMAVKHFPQPSTKELMRFLVVGYYLGFCKNFSTVVAPLSNL